LKTSHPKKNMTARDSNGGMSRVRMASDGQVAHSGMAKAPMQVQVFGERLRRLTDGGLRSPNHSVVLDMCSIPSVQISGSTVFRSDHRAVNLGMLRHRVRCFHGFRAPPGQSTSWCYS